MENIGGGGAAHGGADDDGTEEWAEGLAELRARLPIDEPTLVRLFQAQPGGALSAAALLVAFAPLRSEGERRILTLLVAKVADVLAPPAGGAKVADVLAPPAGGDSGAFLRLRAEYAHAEYAHAGEASVGYRLGLAGDGVSSGAVGGFMEEAARAAALARATALRAGLRGADARKSRPLSAREPQRQPPYSLGAVARARAAAGPVSRPSTRPTAAVDGYRAEHTPRSHIPTRYAAARHESVPSLPVSEHSIRTLLAAAPGKTLPAHELKGHFELGAEEARRRFAVCLHRVADVSAQPGAQSGRPVLTVRLRRAPRPPAATATAVVDSTGGRRAANAAAAAAAADAADAANAADAAEADRAVARASASSAVDAGSAEGQAPVTPLEATARTP
ncbi:hypothetical protein T492DRAFT_863745 [Pavlovales sp. CCMP2436]|nr:hypothetical protein T492DRAFT_863745 [Pavlovales sp. CCMP2436]